MLGKEKQKYLAALRLKKKRKTEKKFIVEGVRSVTEGLKSDYYCEELFVVKNSELPAEIFSLAEKKKIKITEVGSAQLKKITDTVHPQNVAALFRIKETDFSPGDFILAFDKISDPGNLGTLIRTADWFGVKNILVSCDSVEILNPKVVRATMGSVFHVNYKCVKNLAEELSALKKKGFRIALADLEGIAVDEFERASEKLALVLSNEAEGPGEEIKATADVRLNIPKLGYAESLNVSVAGGILIYALTRK